MKNMKFTTTFLALLLSSTSAQAWEGISTDKTVRLESVGGASNGGNFDLRVTLSRSIFQHPILLI